MAASLLLLLGQALAVRASGRVHPARDPMAATALLGRADPSASLRRRRTPRRRTRAPEAEQRLRLCASPFAARAPLAALTRLPRALVPAPLLAGGDERRRPTMADLNVTNFRIDARLYTMPRIDLHDRRSGGQPRLIRWVFQRHLEMVLYNRSDGGSTGAIWKLLNAAGLGRTTLSINKAAVQTQLITQEELTACLAAFKTGLPADVIDPCAANKIRSTALIPVTAAAAIVRTFGRSEASMEWLRVFGQNVPQAWELQQQQEDDAAAGEVDLLLQDQLDEHGFEAEDFTLVRAASLAPPSLVPLSIANPTPTPLSG